MLPFLFGHKTLSKWLILRASEQATLKVDNPRAWKHILPDLESDQTWESPYVISSDVILFSDEKMGKLNFFKESCVLVEITCKFLSKR